MDFRAAFDTSIATPPPGLPLVLRPHGGHALVVGAGEAAESKLRLLRRAGFVVRRGRAGFDPAELVGAAIVIAASGDATRDAAVSRAARARGVLVNVVDRPELSDVTIPAIVDRAPVLIAISSGGASPVLARRLRERIEALLPPGLGRLAAWAGRWRGPVAARLPRRAARRRFWEALFDSPFAQEILDGGPVRLPDAIDEVLETAASGGGAVSIVGAGNGGPELVTLGALRALQRADWLVHDAAIDPAVLDLARREARRARLAEPCADAAGLLIRLAREGHQVVRLWRGDAAMSGPAGAEFQALAAAGVSARHLPGPAGADLPCRAAA